MDTRLAYRPHGSRLLVLFAAAATIFALWCAPAAVAQQVLERDGDLADLPVSVVRIEGAEDDEERLIVNNTRLAVGDPYSAAVLRNDVNRVFNLGRFAFVTAYVTLLDDGTVEVLIQVVPQPLVRAVQSIGNKAFSDQELRALILQVPGGPRDEFLIERAKRDIKARYREKGYYLTDVTIDESELDERGLLIFNVIEGPRVRIKSIVFDGAAAFDSGRLKAELKTKAHVPILRAGILDEDVIAADIATLDAFYKDRGYLDVRIGHSIDLSPDSTEAKVTFHLDEGRVYTLRSIELESLVDPDAPLKVFTADQIAALLAIRPGDVYSRDRLRKSLKVVEEAYGRMGYLDVRVVPNELRRGPEPEVDLRLSIDEGRFAKVGVIDINGNFLTRDKVLRRLLKVKPGRPFDTVALQESERRIARTRLFNSTRTTVQDPDPLEPMYRDLLIEIKERDTGAVNFGVAVGSDSGLFGEISVQQDNFDIGDVPRSLEELLRGRAFRGAGQRFSMVLRPGDELFSYSVSLTEPRFLDTPYALSVSGAFRDRNFRDYDEQRLTGTVSLERSFGDVWQIGFRTRAESVELDDIDSDAPVEVFRDAGPDHITSIGALITRTTIESFTRPGRGSRFELSLDYIGAFGGDFDFWKTSAEWTSYYTLTEDFFGRKSTIKLNAQLGYIFGGSRAPTYERFYLGGRTFRGLEFRTVSPKGIRADTLEQGNDPVGGEWLAFVGAQYEFPLVEEIVTGVFFVDSGTVTNDPGVDDWRVSVGVGVRLYIQALGPVPIAFDFGFPVIKDDRDESRLLTFSAELPF